MRQTRLIVGAILFAFFAAGAVSAAPSGGRNAAVVKALDSYESKRSQAVRQMSSANPGQQAGSQSPSVGARLVSRRMAEKLFSFEMGFETYSYKYAETVGGRHFMDLKGTFSGIYSKIIWRPDLSQSNYWKDYTDHFILDARVGWAKLDYTGGITDNSGNAYPAVSYDNPNMVIELRGLAAKDFAWREMTVTPYAGLGYRHLTDDSTEQDTIVLFEGDWYNIGPVGGYKRISNYYYFPIGVDVVRSISNGWKIGLNAELDYLFYGKQISKVEFSGQDPDTGETLTFPNITNQQKQGFGLRTSLRLEKEVGKCSFSIEPFFRYWNIEDSEWARWDKSQTDSEDIDWTAPAIEPSNTTQEIGMRMGMLF